MEKKRTLLKNPKRYFTVLFFQVPIPATWYSIRSLALEQPEQSLKNFIEIGVGSNETKPMSKLHKNESTLFQTLCSRMMSLSLTARRRNYESRLAHYLR